MLREHGHFVQGVAWDPLGRLLLTASCDRSVRVWQLSWKQSHLQAQVLTRLSRQGERSLFQDETLVSFFRRCAFSPEGSFALLPAGLGAAEGGRHASSSFYILPRSQCQHQQQQQAGGMLSVDGFEKGVVAIRCNPRLFEPRADDLGEGEALLQLPGYRVIWAAASQNALTIHDSHRPCPPLFHCTGFHYGHHTDIAW